MRHRKRRQKDHLIYYVFDLLYLNGRDLRGLPLRRRKEILNTLVENSALPGIEFSDHVEAQGKALFEVATKRGLEGIVGKNADSPYVSGSRTDYWLKFKNYRIESFHIGGFTGSLNQIESVLLGRLKGKELIFVGHTDKGLGRDQNRKRLQDQLAKPLRSSSPFKNRPDVTAPIVWVEPNVTCRVRFLEATQDGLLRHATVVGLD